MDLHLLEVAIFISTTYLHMFKNQVAVIYDLMQMLYVQSSHWSCVRSAPMASTENKASDMEGKEFLSCKFQNYNTCLIIAFMNLVSKRNDLPELIFTNQNVNQ